MLLTGEPGTSLLNSVTNGVVTSHVLANLFVKNTTDVTREYRKFGLVAKNPMLTSDHQLTDYLKGVFLKDCQDKYTWIRLPSFLCKFGKVLTNPKTILPHVKDSEKRARMLLYYQWLGYGDMATNWFYSRLNDMIVKHCSFDYDKETLANLVEIETDFVMGSWQITQASCYVPDHEWNDFMRKRYSVTVEDMEMFLYSYERWLSSPIPSGYSDQLVYVLGRRDY